MRILRSGPDSEVNPAATRALTVLALLGFGGALLLVIGGGLAGAAAPGASGRLWSVPTVPVRPVAGLVPALVLFYGGMILLVRAWLALRRHQLTHGLSLTALAVIVGLWSLPLLVGPPLGSRDVYAYAAQGRLAEQGYDVYEEGPSRLGADDPVLAPVDPLYHDAPVVYGPVFVFVASQIARITGEGVIVAVLIYRLMAVIGLLVAAAAVHDLARGLGRDPVDALVLAFANPLVLLHLVSGAHNEAIMLAFLVGGVTIGRRGGALRHVGIALCAMAAAIKLPAILAVAFLGWPWVLDARHLPTRVLRLAISALEALVVIALAGQLTGWGWGWVDAILGSDPVDAYLSLTRVAGGAVALTTGLDSDAVLSVARLLGFLVAATLTTLLLVRGHRSWPLMLAWSLLIWAVLHPTTQPWYLTWSIMFLAASSAGERNRSFVIGCAVAAFVVMPVGPQLGLLLLEDTGYVSIAVGAVLLAALTLTTRSGAEPRRRTSLRPGAVTVVVPTRHEQESVGPLVAALERLDDSRYEVLFVDDSDDATPQVIEQVAAEASIGVSVLHRPSPERWGGLGGAVVDGLEQATGSIVVVMDADGQHPVASVPDLVRAIEHGRNDIAVGSRHIAGGMDEGLTWMRRVLSGGAAGLARSAFPVRVGRVADPLSGFFALRLGAVDLARLQPDGFKILVELLATHPEMTVDEVPFAFAERAEGLSKASGAEAARYVGHLVDLRLRTSRPWSGAPLPQRAFRSA